MREAARALKILENSNITEILIAVITAYLAYLTAKKTKEPEGNKMILDKYDDLYALVEKQRDEQAKTVEKLRDENEKLRKRVDELSKKVLHLEKRESSFREVIRSLTGLTYEEYVEKENELEGDVENGNTN